jgi:hypothetical protein
VARTYANEGTFLPKIRAEIFFVFLLTGTSVPATGGKWKMNGEWEREKR